MGNNNLTKEDIANLEQIMDKMGMGDNPKVVKQNTGLIERKKRDKVIITEDNKQILTD